MMSADFGSPPLPGKVRTPRCCAAHIRAGKAVAVSSGVLLSSSFIMIDFKPLAAPRLGYVHPTNFAFHRVKDSSTAKQRTLLYSGGGGQALLYSGGGGQALSG
jgi:hypothetical protein